MASVIDSIRSVYQDNYSLLKLGTYSGIIYMLYSMMSFGNNFNFINLIVGLIIFYITCGFTCIIINNRITQNLQTLPSLNPIKFVRAATQAFIIAIPFSLIGYFLVNFVVGLFSFEGVPQLTTVWIIRFFIFEMLITAWINFSEKFSIKDGLNISKLLAGVADVLVYTVVCFLVTSIFIAFVAGPTLYLIYNFFKIGPFFIYTAVLFINFIIAIFADYWGQLHFDIESKNNYY